MDGGNWNFVHRRIFMRSLKCDVRALKETAMDVDSRLFVEIHPFDGPHPPHPHPIDEGGFDPSMVYKVLGVFNPSETSECYFMLANPQRQIWFIPQRHLLAYRLIDSDEFFLPKVEPVDRASGRAARGRMVAGGDDSR
ncbi:MAG: hypothetical protein JWN40_2181 [Phycisphaerales bacterium]|nr:hypothetical protein [Phycisphaerales bacterium]